MNRPEIEKPPFNGGSNKSKNDLPPRRSVKNPEEESLRIPYEIPTYLMITRNGEFAYRGRDSSRIKGVRKNERKADRNG